MRRTAAPWPASDFWDWSLTVYARPGVAGACLALQERHGLDVNLLLFVVWSGSEGRVLEPAAIRAAIDRVRRWQQEIVHPLRALRRRLKNDAHGLDVGLASTVRARIAAVELDAEHAEQIALTGLAAVALARPVPAGEAIAGNLAAYAEAAGLSWTETDRRDLDIILARVLG
jgi:uncharacterized protein (TIGR02444 family)